MTLNGFNTIASMLAVYGFYLIGHYTSCASAAIVFLGLQGLIGCAHIETIDVLREHVAWLRRVK